MASIRVGESRGSGAKSISSKKLNKKYKAKSKLVGFLKQVKSELEDAFLGNIKYRKSGGKKGKGPTLQRGGMDGKTFNAELRRIAAERGIEWTDVRKNEWTALAEKVMRGLATQAKDTTIPGFRAKSPAKPGAKSKRIRRVGVTSPSHLRKMGKGPKKTKGKKKGQFQADPREKGSPSFYGSGKPGDVSSAQKKMLRDELRGGGTHSLADLRVVARTHGLSRLKVEGMSRKQVVDFLQGKLFGTDSTAAFRNTKSLVGTEKTVSGQVKSGAVVKGAVPPTKDLTTAEYADIAVKHATSKTARGKKIETDIREEALKSVMGEMGLARWEFKDLPNKRKAKIRKRVEKRLNRKYYTKIKRRKAALKSTSKDKRKERALSDAAGNILDAGAVDEIIASTTRAKSGRKAARRALKEKLGPKPKVHGGWLTEVGTSKPRHRVVDGEVVEYTKPIVRRATKEEIGVAEGSIKRIQPGKALMQRFGLTKADVKNKTKKYKRAIDEISEEIIKRQIQAIKSETSPPGHARSVYGQTTAETKTAIQTAPIETKKVMPKGKRKKIPRQTGASGHARRREPMGGPHYHRRSGQRVLEQDPAYGTERLPWEGGGGRSQAKPKLKKKSGSSSQSPKAKARTKMRSKVKHKISGGIHHLKVTKRQAELIVKKYDKIDPNWRNNPELVKKATQDYAREVKEISVLLDRAARKQKGKPSKYLQKNVRFYGDD